MILSKETKSNLSKAIGIPYEELILMDDDEVQKCIEQKIGKKLKWPKGAKIDGLPIKTIEEMEKSMERPSRSAIFRQNMKIRKEQRGVQEQEKIEPKLPIHKRKLSKEQETR